MAESRLGSRSTDPEACLLPCASWLLGAGTGVPILLLQMLFLELNAVLKFLASGSLRSRPEAAVTYD